MTDRSKSRLFRLIELDNIRDLNTSETFKVTELARSGDIVQRDTIVFSTSSATQVPTGLDAPMLINYGTGGGDSRITMGSDGKMTCGIDGNYDFRVTLQIARTGQPGIAWIVFRVTINGVQAFGTLLHKMETTNQDTPIQLDWTLPLTQGDVVEVWMARDSNGTNDGILETQTNNQTGWDDTPSASMAISQYIIK